MSTAPADPELDEMARRVIDGTVYQVLATIEPDGTARVSPVYFVAAGYRRFYWVSSPDAHHSRNLTERPQVSLVVFDSRVEIGRGEAVYVTATARVVADDELDETVTEAFDRARGARAFSPAELSGTADLRLYVATATAYDVHVAAGHPTHGRGIDVRLPADPTRR